MTAAARSWADKALAVAAQITPPARTAECDVGCATATHNLGEFAEMDGDLREARRRYDEAAQLAKVLAYAEGIQASRDGLKRLAEREKEAK